MKPSLDDLFVRLEPPPGGEALLRARLAGAPRRSHRLRWAALTAVPAVAALLLWLALPRPAAHRRAVAPYPLSHPALIELGLEVAPTAPVTVPAAMRGRVAVTEVSVQPGVVYYRVASSLPGLDQDDAPPPDIR